jgi:hypothetical protein
MSAQIKALSIQGRIGRWEPSPQKIQVGRYLVADGKNLPKSVTEDIGGFCLAPKYSSKQLRRITRLQKRHLQTSKEPKSHPNYKHKQLLWELASAKASV